MARERIRVVIADDAQPLREMSLLEFEASVDPLLRIEAKLDSLLIKNPEAGADYYDFVRGAARGRGITIVEDAKDG